MRKIKFRGYDGMDWVYGSAIQYDEETDTWYMLEDGEIDNWVMVGDVGQFTGLKDKNGKEVYEGDIVNVNFYGGTPRYEKVHFYTVGGFMGFHPFTDSGHHWSAKLCEVVGNIYDDSELISAKFK